MGNRKRPPTSLTKHPPSPSPAAASEEPDHPNSVTPESDGSTIKQECGRALNALRRGNHTKALRIMKDSCAKHGGDALIHRVHGTVCVKVSSIIDDPNSKQRHLKNAIEAARRAAELSPNSIEFAHFYANLLYEAASDGKEYEEVMKECDRALKIENPIDPAKESLQEESQQKIATAEGRIAHVQGELKNLQHKSNIASISTWMKNLGTGEEIRLIPIRRATEDPMEVRLVQTRRPNEIKKATKTQEERRKEIEVRVAAARLLQQQKSEMGLGQSEGERSDQGVAVTPGSDRRGERRKCGSNARKNGTNTERKDWVRSYWNSMTLEMKRELLKIKVSDLKGYFWSSKDGLASDVLNELLAYGLENKSWGFWVCCRCNEKFVDADSHLHHVVQEHMGSLMPKMQEVLPQSADNEWIEMILNSSWKPLDISSAVKMPWNQGKCHNGELGQDFCSEYRNEDRDDFFKDARDSSPEKENLRDDYSSCPVSSSNSDKVYNIEGKEFDGNQSSIAYTIDSWPISEDSERAKLLEKIHDVFQALIGHKYLAASHLNKVIQLTMAELQNLASGSRLLNRGVGQTPNCICFLGASQLKKILKFLQEISHYCGLGRSPEKSIVVDGSNSGAKGPEIKEEIVLNGDEPCLCLDERLLSLEYAPSTYNDATTATSTIAAYGNGVQPDADAMLSWIFAGLSSGEQLQSWIRTKEEKMHQGMEILQTLEKEFYHLQSLCERKCEHLGYEQALQAVEDLCLEEGKKRETDMLVEHRSYDSVLRQRREQLVENEHDALFISSRFELDAILNVLKEADTLNANQFGYEDTYGGITSQFCDLESGEDGNWRTKDHVHQVETCIEIAIQRQKEQLSIELGKIDAQIMRNVTGMQQLELKLESVSALDYRSILLPLVKSYMRAHLEDLAEKDATEKSDAAREAFLAELALDSKKGTHGRSDNSRNTLEKGKDKRKNKEYKKTKDSKVVAASEQQLLQDATNGRGSFPDASDGNYPDSQSRLSVSDDDLKQQEEEFRWKNEIEEEERMLEESLEYQRRIENEAKQKHLAEQQHKKSNLTFPEKLSGGLHDYCFDPAAADSREPLEQLTQKRGLPNNLEGMPMTTASELSTGGSAEGGPSDRRPGRRSRRQKSSSRSSDGKNQPMLSETENSETRSITSNLGDSATKTLRQLKVEEEDEERFQADLEKAMRQSLDTFQANQKIPMMSSLKAQQTISSELGNSGTSPYEVATVNVDGTDVFGTGLKNDIGDYNCFLNVIIQSLWHLRRFRDEFLSRSQSEHVHVGDPCVVCALYDILTAMSTVSMDTRREAVAPTSLRIALSNLYPNSNFFQEGQMNDASEVLAVIFDCLHRAFTSGLHGSDSEAVEHSGMESWECTKKNACIVHSLFGMDISEQMNCQSCGVESRHLKYSAFFHNINASALRTMKVMCAESSFDELLNLVEMNHQLACDTEAGGCGRPNYTHHILSTPPHVFTTVLGWQKTCESIDDITATLTALNTEIDISVFYRGLDPKNIRSLVSVVCYYGQHYHCFAYSQDHDQWIMYDDKTVKVIGSWTDVLTMCGKGHLQPQVLFFEAGN